MAAGLGKDLVCFPVLFYLCKMGSLLIVTPAGLDLTA